MANIQFSSRGGGGIGCLLFGVLVLVAAYYILSGFFFLLWWAAPALFVLALIINWRAVLDTGQSLLKYIQTNPVAGLVIAVLVIIGTGILPTGVVALDRLGYWIAQGGFTLLSLYVLLRALGYNQLNQFRNTMSQQGYQQPPEEEFIEFEELDSKPKNAPPSSDEHLGPPPQSSKREKPDSDKPFDQLFQ